jgi:3-methyladenine DNA glycosylase Mpg
MLHRCSRLSHPRERLLFFSCKEKGISPAVFDNAIRGHKGMELAYKGYVDKACQASERRTEPEQKATALLFRCYALVWS